NYDIPITNFQTIPEGPVRAKLTFGMLEGDRSLEGDELLMKNTSGDYVKLSTDTRPEDNFFNSRITMNGEDFLDRNPASSNTLGYDLGLFELDNTGNQFLDNNQTSTSIRIASTRELFNFYMIGFSVHVWEPTLQDFMLTSESYDIAPGETTVLSLNIDNGWNDDIQDLNISTIIPEGFDFVGVIGLPDGVSYSYDEDTRVLTFTKDSITLDDTAFSLNFEVRAKSRCFFVENDCQDSISIQSNATYNGTINPSGFTSLSSHTKDACEIHNDDATTFNVDMGDQGCDPNFVEQTFELSACVFDGMMDLTTYIPDGMPDNGTYTYTSGNGGELDNGIFNPRNADAGQHLVTYSVPDETCTRSLEFQIDLNRDCPNPNCELEDIIISKALTLNGDNINDVFLVSTEEDCNYTYDITIFNRWGNIVYENPDYQNDWEGTAPENAMGEAYTLPTGTYYYILKVVELDNQAKSGYFYLGTD
ncbi:MAG: gliding motility-associated C-terminal domain-containing protein, partial [Flavobacteriaceae bacterium]